MRSGGIVDVDYFNDVAVDVRGRAAATTGTIRKGMTVAELEAVNRRVFESRTTADVTTNKYHWQDGILEADFFNGVLVAYRITSK